jgi:hypothetical protein
MQALRRVSTPHNVDSHRRELRTAALYSSFGLAFGSSLTTPLTAHIYSSDFPEHEGLAHEKDRFTDHWASQISEVIRHLSSGRSLMLAHAREDELEDV